jgi:hypothetical protein
MHGGVPSFPPLPACLPAIVSHQAEQEVCPLAVHDARVAVGQLRLQSLDLAPSVRLLFHLKMRHTTHCCTLHVVASAATQTGLSSATTRNTRCSLQEVGVRSFQSANHGRQAHCSNPSPAEKKNNPLIGRDVPVPPAPTRRPPAGRHRCRSWPARRERPSSASPASV